MYSLISLTILVVCVILFKIFNQLFFEKLRLLICHIHVWAWLRKSQPIFDFQHDSEDAQKVGMTSLPEAWRRENPREIHDNAIDSIEFSGVTSNGDVIIMRIIRHCDRCSEVFLYLKLTSGDEFELPIHPDCRVYNTDNKSFSAAGLKFELLEPLRRWKISFNGLLRKGTRKNWNDHHGESILVKFNFLWIPINDYVGFPNDFGSKILIKNLENQITSYKQLFSHQSPIFQQEWHEQFGQIHGTLNIGLEPEVIVLFRGLKNRKHGNDDWNFLKKRISIRGVTEHGCCFHLFSIENETNFNYGYVCPPCNTVIRHLDSCDVNITQLTEEDGSTLTFKAGGRQYDLEVIWNKHHLCLYRGEKWNFQNDFGIFRFKLNGKFGYGFMETIEPYFNICPIEERQLSLPHLVEPSINDDNRKLVLTFDEINCRSSKLVGGKGASLALMTNLLIGNDKTEFKVPQGFCLTTLAFEEHIESNSNLKIAIKSLQDVAWKKVIKSLDEECEKVVCSFKKTHVSDQLKTELDSELKLIFGNNYVTMEFAVRSSAIGEDGEEMSAAGQNETFLGVRGFQKLCEAIVKCWASQFSYRSIEYKRQNGQILNGGMGVVIQEMIPANTSGVLFTHNPMTGCHNHIMISANYGLGETVVSGNVDPDTWFLQRTMNERLTIIEKHIGTKSVRMTTSGIFKVEPDTACQQSMSDEMAMTLAKIAIYLEKCSGSARDLEWALHGDNLYILQSRPVTAENNYTDYDVIHEFDSHSRTDNEYYSTANIGEILPGAKSTLASVTSSRATYITYMDTSTWKLNRQRYDPTFDDCFGDFYGISFYNRMLEKIWNPSEVKTSIAKNTEISLHGRVVKDDQQLQKIAIERADDPSLSCRMMLPLHSIKALLCGNRILRNCVEKYSAYPVLGFGTTTAEDCYKEITDHLWDIGRVIKNHSYMSYASMWWNLPVLILLKNKTEVEEGNVDFKLYADFSKLVGNAGSESSDVPKSIAVLAAVIARDIDAKSFCAMSSKEALDWIKMNENESRKKFENFMETHGHRGFKEIDVFAKSWDMEPEKLIVILQGMLKSTTTCSNENFREETPSDEAIKSIKAQWSPLKRMLFLWLLKRCRNAVSNREKAKSLLVKVIHGFRRGYRHLAALMIQEGYLPNEELIFFMTHEEIGIHIKCRSAKLLTRAKQRRRLYTYKNQLQFPESIIGIPKPLNTMENSNEETDSSLNSLTEMKGIPVSHGQIQGPAKVLDSFHQVNKIQPGDILITPNTDIAWSPYFPMLAGLVTEMGGIISHCSVVAREFGLPCMVGTKNATKIFKSGEIVFLDATKGTISKVN